MDSGSRVVIQEDAGDSDYVGKIWLVDPATNSATQIFEADRNRFLPGAAGYLTSAEETSGVIEITDLVRNAPWSESGRRYYLGVTQAHYPLDATLVEGGQMYLLAAPK